MKLTISQNDIEQIESSIEKYLSSFHSDMDFSRGTPLNDIMVQAFKVPLALLTSVANKFRETRSLSGIQRLLTAINSADPTDPDIIASKADLDSAVQEVLSNWYIEKQTGTRARGLINLHFTSNPSLLIPSNFKSSRASNLSFVHASSTDVLISPTDYQVIKDSSGLVLEYVYRISVEATSSGDIGDVEPGTWDTFDQISPFLYKVSSDFSFVRGRPDEDTQSLINRARSGGVTERTLHNQRALNARFALDFPDTLPVRVIGAGEPEMQRDLVYLGGNLKIHRLNHWNIYIGGNIEESKVYVGVLGQDFVSPRTGLVTTVNDNYIILPFEPILNIREIRWLDDGTDARLTPYVDSDGYLRISLISGVSPAFTDINQAYLQPLDEESVHYWNTSKQTHILVVNPDLFQSTAVEIEIVYDALQGYSIVDDFIRNAEDRPAAGDPLVYSYYPAVVSFDLEFKRDIHSSSSFDQAEAKRVLTSFVRSQKNGNPLFASEIMREFMETYGDVAAGVYPITLNYTVLCPNGGILEYSSLDSVSVDDVTKLIATSYQPSEDLSEFQLSDRTMMVFTDEVNINIIER
jgi:hypothetical protein